MLAPSALRAQQKDRRGFGELTVQHADFHISPLVLTFCLTPSPTRVLRSFLVQHLQGKTLCVFLGIWGLGRFVYPLKCARTSCLQLLPASPPLVERCLHFSRFLWRKLPCSLLVLPTAGSSLRPEGLQSQLLPALLHSSFRDFVCFSPPLSSPIWLLVCLFFDAFFILLPSL